MARDDCKDCERHFPGGAGLADGRCPSCYIAFLARNRPATPRLTKPRRKPKGN